MEQKKQPEPQKQIMIDPEMIKDSLGEKEFTILTLRAAVQFLENEIKELNKNVQNNHIPKVA